MTSKRSYQQLRESERHAIALGRQQKQSLRAIARALGRDKSTITEQFAEILMSDTIFHGNGDNTFMPVKPIKLTKLYARRL